MIEVGALNMDSEVSSDGLSVKEMVTDIERIYLVNLIQSFLQSESQRMFEFLEARTFSVFEQIN